MNIIGEGPRSAERAVTTGSSVKVPGAPGLASATAGNGWVGLGWTAPATDGGAPITSYRATASPGGASCTTTGATACTIGGLTNGTNYTFTVTATNSVGTGAASNVWAAMPVAPPTARITALAMFRNTTTIPVSWGSTLGTLPIGNYDVRYRSAPWNGSLGGYVTWLGGTAATAATFTGAAGNTYCFGVRARDIHGNESGWTADTCTVVPLDDRSLSRSSYWSTGTSGSFYKSTYVRSSTSGAKLTRTGVVAKRISIVATTCSTCGSVRVYWGSTLLEPSACTRRPHSTSGSSA